MAGPSPRNPIGDPAPARSFADALQQSFRKHATLPAIEGRHTLYTYEDLDRRSAALANALANAGVLAGDIVPLLVRRSPDLIVAQVALIRMGAAYAPIDLASPPERQLAMLHQIHPKILLADRASEAPSVDGCRVVELNDLEALESTCNTRVWRAMPPAALAYVMFTSGTTGVPKGVLIPQSGIRRLVCDAQFANMQIGARWAFASSPAFDASTLETWAPLLNGGCCVVQELVNPSIDDLASFLADQNITDAWLTSALFSALVDDRPDAFRTLSQLLTGGERVSPQHARALLLTYPDLHLINGYGPTENTTFTLCHPITLADTANPIGIPVGTPISGTVVRIGNEPIQPNEGELYAGGLGAALGYLGDAELTARKFVEIEGQTWYRTGDIVRRGRGEILEFVGRADRQVKLQGHRVELDEVERVIGLFPGVSGVVVRLRGTTAETRHLVAHYTVQIAQLGKPSQPVGAGEALELHTWLQKRLPPPEVPSLIVRVDRLPINSSGKVDHSALDAFLESNGPTHPEFATQPADTERRLADLWKRLFPTASIHKGANFNALGGNSLTALQLSAQVRRQFGRDLSPIDVLRTPVLSEQARLIEAAAPFDYETVPATCVGPQLMLTQVQRAMLASAELDDSGSAFLVHVALRLAGAVDGRALRQGFQTLASRHPSLRLRVPSGGDASHGTISAELPTGWWQERPALEAAPTDLAWPASLLADINRPLDLSKDGVMRVNFWPIASTGAENSALLVWTIHHVSMDEASIDRCLAELHDLMLGKSLPPVYGSPLGFATFEKSSIDRAAAHEWPAKLLSELAGVEPPLSRSPAKGGEFAIDLSRDTSSRVLKACERWSITPFTPLLLAYGEALQEVFGPAHRFVSTPFSRRAEEELVEPVGCLLDLRVIDAGLRESESQSAALVRVNETVQKLQQPTFFPRTAVAEVLGRRDPMVAQQLSMFGFTWRLNPSRAIPLGALNAQLLRVPQQGARFGVTLHAWLDGDTLGCSIEAICDAIDTGRAAAVGEAFARHLDNIANLQLPSALGRGASREHEMCADDLCEPTVEKIRGAWSNRLSISPNDVQPNSHFLCQGGNSLAAMRLASQLRREHGIAIDVGAFLARPTFAALCSLASGPRSHVPGCSVILGNVDAPHVVVIFPGNLGNSLGSYRLADELVRRLGAQYAVAIVDLETMLLRAPHDQLVAFLGDRIYQLANELGWNRIAAVAGLSSGGLLALNLLASRKLQTGEPQDIPVWLVDTYAPLDWVQNAMQQYARPVVRYVIRHPVVTRWLRPADPEKRKQETDAPSMLTQLKHEVHQQLYDAWTWPRANDVHLVQALKTVRDVALTWRRGSNGFHTTRFARWQVHPLDGSHSELSRELAPATAEFMARSLTSLSP